MFKTISALKSKAAVDPVYRYVPVNQFTPLSNTSWFSLNQVVSGERGPTRRQYNLTVGSIDRGTLESGDKYLVSLNVISMNRNVFRVQFDPAQDPETEYASKVFGPIQQSTIDQISEYEETYIKFRGFTFEDNTLTFSTKDLDIEISSAFVMTVSFNGEVIHKDALDSNGNSLGATFVDQIYGPAIATVKENRKEDSSLGERFYGQGEVNVNVGGPVESGGYYVQGKTGLAMTNFNYDQITYTHSELAPQGYGLDTSIPNYFYPMYFSAPWIIVTGRPAATDQYAYGIFLDDPAQTYVNTGDETYGPDAGQSDKFYLGGQSGALDYYFIFGVAQSETRQSVQNVVEGLAYMTRDVSQATFEYAAMPPDYIFGYFQGIYGATGVNEGAFTDGCTMPENGIFLEEILSSYQDLDIPLEGFAIDIDIQETYNVFTTNSRFWYDGDTEGRSVFQWANDEGLVCQTNITCFVKDQNRVGDVFDTLVAGKFYTKNQGVDGIEFQTDGFGPDDAYCGQLQYGTYAKTTAVFPDWGKTGVDDWWGEQYKKLFSIGLDFVWQDMTTPSADTHIIGNAVTDNVFDEGTLEIANSASPDSGTQDYASSFNWRSYHSQVLLTDPRFEDQRQASFAEVRNQHAFFLCSATFEKGLPVKKEEGSRLPYVRSYVIARGGQIGSGRFGGLWTGDNATTWMHLNLMIPMNVSMNLSGISIVGSDIGGFAQADSDYDSGKNEGMPASPELLTRWVQAGFLLPWFRNHYDRWVGLDTSTNSDCAQWEPKEHGKPYQEITNSAYSGVASGEKTYQDVMRETIEMRYRWQHVLYSAAADYATLGIPVIKSMCMWDGDLAIDFDNLVELNSQFLLGGQDGKSILAAPVTSEGQASRGIYLPTDATENVNWFAFEPDFDDNDIYKYYPGGQDVKYDCDISTTAVFVRQGAILPTRYTEDGSVKSVNRYSLDNDPMVLDVFSAVDGVQDAFYYVDNGGVDIGTVVRDFQHYGLRTDEVTDTSVTYSAGYAENNTGNHYQFPGALYIRIRAVGVVTSVTIDDASIGVIDATNKYDFFAQVQTNGVDGYWLDGKGSIWIRGQNIPMGKTVQVIVECSDTINRSTSILECSKRGCA